MQKPSELTNLKNLSKEQIEQLKKFAELPAEKKAELLEKQCIFCQISRGNVETVKVYEDKQLLAILDINPATKGHILLFPRQHFQFLFQIPSDVREKLSELSSKLSIHLINSVKGKGINYYAASGFAAGQRVPHFVLHLIPRFDGDGLSFDWEPKKAEMGELKKIALALKESLKKGSLQKAPVMAKGRGSRGEFKHVLKRLKRIP